MSKKIQKSKGDKSPNITSEVNPVLEKVCKSCNGKMIERRGNRGLFYGCSNYPKCHYTEPK